MRSGTLSLLGVLLLALLLASGSRAQPSGSQIDPSIAKKAIGYKPLPPPTLSAAMPFSSCNPGGAVMVKGENLGRTPGKLRLLGDFLDSPVYLQNIEWSEGGVGGQVPEVRGAIDQEVRIQAVRPDGKVTNVIRCQFTATRETQNLIWPDDFKFGEQCNWGDNYDSGIVHLGENTNSDRTASLPGSGFSPFKPPYDFFGCVHLANTRKGDRNAVDHFEIKQLLNGWKTRAVKTSTANSYPNRDRGAITEFKGWAANSTSVKLRVAWMVPEGQHFYWRGEISVEGPAGVSWSEQVVAKRHEENLDDWNPHADTRRAEVVITSPAAGSEIDAQAQQFELTLKPRGSSDTKLALGLNMDEWVVDLEWVSYSRVKDRSIQKYVAVSGAPKSVRLGELPMKIDVSQLGGEGHYGLRAKRHRDDDLGWTDMQEFWIGKKPTVALSAGGIIDAPAGKKILDAKLGKAPRGLGSSGRGLSLGDVQKNPAAVPKPPTPNAAQMQEVPRMGGKAPRVDPAAAKKLPAAVPPPPSGPSEEEEQELRVDPSIRFPR